MGIAVVKVISGNYRHKRAEDGTLVRAWSITLPGYVTHIECENTVTLKNWVGTKSNSITITHDGQESPEANAGIALLLLGMYEDHTLKQNDAGEWILYKPEKRTRYFTWSAYYRIGPWEKVEEIMPENDDE